VKPVKTIFVVDDNGTSLMKAADLLEDDYRIFTMLSADSMFSMLEKKLPDLILLDIHMPEMDGFEALGKLKENEKYSSIPVIFLTSTMDAETEAKCFEAGGVDFVRKPFHESVLRNRVRHHVEIGRLVKERTEKYQRLQHSLVLVLSDLVENRDAVTGGHIERTAAYLELLIAAMQENPKYRAEMAGWDIKAVAVAARLHDIGKVSVSDVILNKPDRLDETEYEVMKAHALKGEMTIERIIKWSGENEFLTNAKLFAGYHHERWDGTGYPRGLSGGDIPLQGRLMAIVDVYDALVSKRPYKDAVPCDQAIEIIRDESGKHFDPAIAEIFCGLGGELAAAAGRLRPEYESEAGDV
jgi:putative two-component system response regulator